MTQKTEELILEQLFKLSDRIDYIEKNMATKKDLEGMATKEDIKDMATKKDLEEMAQKLEARMDAKFDEQTKEIATMFHDTFNTTTKYQKQMESRIIKLVNIKKNS